MRRPISNPNRRSASPSIREGGSPERPAGILVFPAVDEAIQEGARRNDHGAGLDPAAVKQPDAARARPASRAAARAVLQDKVHHLGLFDSQVRLRLEHLTHLRAILLLVGLRAGRPDGGSAAGVEQSELDAGRINHLAHDAAERVDLAHQVAFGDSADGGITGHLRDQVEVDRAERGLQAHARRGHRGLAAGVPRAHDNHIVLFREVRQHGLPYALPQSTILAAPAQSRTAKPKSHFCG